MAGDKTKDLTSGNPLKLIISFAIPIYLGMIFQQLYNIIDTMIVGKMLGVNALASVGATGSVIFMVIGFCNGVSSGFAIPIAQYFGAKDEKKLKQAAANDIYLSLICATILTILVTYYCRDILECMNTPLDIIQGSYDYLIVIFWGIPITFFYNLFAGIMRSLGDSRTPVLFLILASVMNIVLDVFLILVVGMGVEGAAYATVISQLIAALFSGYYMMKKFPVLHMDKEDRRMNLSCMLHLCYIGLSMGLQYSITAVGTIVLQTAVNGLGSMAVASLTAGARICGVFGAVFEALGSSMATYGGQNAGAKKLDRVKKGLYTAWKLGFCYSLIAFLVVMLLGDKLALLFVDSSEQEIIKDVTQLLRLETFFYPLLTLVNCTRFTIQGMGFSMFAVIAGVMELIARTVVAYILVPTLGFTGVCLASPVAWLFADVFLVPAFFVVCKILKRRFEQMDMDECSVKFVENLA